MIILNMQENIIFVETIGKKYRSKNMPRLPKFRDEATHIHKIFWFPNKLLVTFD